MENYSYSGSFKQGLDLLDRIEEARQMIRRWQLVEARRQLEWVVNDLKRHESPTNGN